MWDACGQLNIAVAHASDRVGLFTPTDAFQDPICRIAGGKLRRKLGECATERPVSPHENGYRRANRRVGKAAANGPKVFDKYQDRKYLEPMPLPTAANIHRKCSMTSSMRFTIVSWRQTTSTSTTTRAGPSPGTLAYRRHQDCRKRFSAKYISGMHPAN
jgi:hypothetical protein